MCCKIVEHPFDTIKVLMQVNGNVSVAGANDRVGVVSQLVRLLEENGLHVWNSGTVQSPILMCISL